MRSSFDRHSRVLSCPPETLHCPSRSSQRLDPTRLYPHGFHPTLDFMTPDLKGFAKHYHANAMLASVPLVVRVATPPRECRLRSPCLVQTQTKKFSSLNKAVARPAPVDIFRLADSNAKAPPRRQWRRLESGKGLGAFEVLRRRSGRRSYLPLPLSL
ncbi:hypothetical protein BDZ89DRAFT_500987 [Hymenopellis radicata]|nr:hypothetical protein BDZ89DRAFT_500987 [Hymenopellis radicata]